MPFIYNTMPTQYAFHPAHSPANVPVHTQPIAPSSASLAVTHDGPYVDTYHPASPPTPVPWVYDFPTLTRAEVLAYQTKIFGAHLPFFSFPLPTTTNSKPENAHTLYPGHPNLKLVIQRDPTEAAYHYSCIELISSRRETVASTDTHERIYRFGIPLSNLGTVLKWVHEEFEEKVSARGDVESEGSDAETERGFGLSGFNAYAVEAYRLRLERMGLDGEGQADEASSRSSSEATQGYVSFFFWFVDGGH